MIRHWTTDGTDVWPAEEPQDAPGRDGGGSADSETVGTLGGAQGRTRLCGGDETPGPRDDCGSALHEWRSAKCRDCGLYGWIPPMEGTA